MVIAGALLLGGAAAARASTAVAEVAVVPLDGRPGTAERFARLLPAGLVVGELDPIGRARDVERAPDLREAEAATDALIRDGWRAYLAVDADTARQRLREAIARAMALAPWPGGLARVADAALRLGIVDAHLGDARAAQLHLRLAARLAPERRLDASEFSPDVVALVDAVRGPVAPVAVALVLPPDAPATTEIEIDGLRGGARELPPGLHVVVTRGPDVLARAELVEVPETGGEVAISVTPRPGGEALADPPSAGDAATTVRAFLLAVAARTTLGEFVMVATARRPRGVAWLGQRCDRAARCTEVIELAGASGADDALATALWRELSAAPLVGEASLSLDPRLADEVALPMPPSRRWYRRPWVWATAGAVVLTSVAASLLLLDGDAPPPQVAIDPSQF